MNHPIRRSLLMVALPFVLLLGGCKEPGDDGRPATPRDSAAAPGESGSRMPQTVPGEPVGGKPEGAHSGHNVAASAPESTAGTAVAAGRAEHQLVPTAGAQPPSGYATVKIASSRQQLIGLRTGQVTRRSFSRTLRTVGLVSTDETSTTHVNVKFAGWVEDVFVDFVGKRVKKGQRLMSIYSPELWTAQNEYILALQSAEKASEGEGLEGAAARANQEMQEASRRRLQLWDIPDSEIRQLEKTRTPKRALTLNAPVSGTVLVRNVLKGMYVAPGTPLYIFADLSKVWVRAQVYEYEMPYVKLGQKASLTVEALPGRTLQGVVTFIQPTVSESTRTNEVRLEFDNRDGSLKPNMFAAVELDLAMGEGLAIPDEAVIDTGVRKLVFVARDDQTFEPRDVKLGAKMGDYYQVLEGLAEGDRVVVSAQFLLDSESQLRGAAGMGGGHTGHGG